MTFVASVSREIATNSRPIPTKAVHTSIIATARVQPAEARSHFDNRDGPRPAGRGPLDLHREARNHEARRRQGLEVVKFLDMAVADVASRLVALPDDRRIVSLCVAPGGMDERRVPAPTVGAGQPDP